MAAQVNPFAGGAAQAAAAPGYTGLQGIIALLQKGINAKQYANLGQGATGADGMAVGGAGGAFTGLSPYAAHFLASSGLLSAVQPQQADTTGLTGTALLMANLKNQLAQQQPAQYKLADGVTADDLAQLFANGIGGHSAYASGFGSGGPAEGAGSGSLPTPGNPHLPNRQLPPDFPISRGGRPIYGFGRKGNPFFSQAAARAHGALLRGMGGRPGGGVGRVLGRVPRGNQPG